MRVELRELTTLRLGGPAGSYVEASVEHELVEAVRRADAAGTPLLVLGGGSNVVIADEGFPGLVVAVRTRGVHLDASACAGATVEVAAGEPWGELVDRAVDNGWVGLECLAGIPGLTGASPIQNVGAYGQEVADTVASVRTYDREARAIRTLAAANCGFGYRTSRFKREPGRYVVLGVTFQLRLGDLSAPIRYGELARRLDVAPGARAPLGTVRDAVLELRRGKGMVLDAADPDTWSAGSFFTNPVLGAAAYEELAVRARSRVGAVPPSFPAPDGQVKTSAAWLIERAGFGRGYGGGRARVSTKHSLALTNRGRATTAELVELARAIRDGVREVFAVTLEPEPMLVGVDLDERR
jgi:UDP-N-acetylmuramate dehydrogenase